MAGTSTTRPGPRRSRGARPDGADRPWRLRPGLSPVMSSTGSLGRVSATAMLVAGTAISAVLVLARPAGEVYPVAAAVAAAALLGGAGLFVVGPRLPRPAYHLLAQANGALVAVLLAATHDPTWCLAFATIMMLAAIAEFTFLAPATATLYLGFWLAVDVTVMAQRGLAPQATVLAVFCLTGGGLSAWLVQRAARAEVDPFTGLPNRRGFVSLLEQRLQRLARSGGTLSVGVVDVDGFTRHNQQLGVHGADRLLLQCVAALRAVMPRETVLARASGDGFAVMLPEVCAEDAVTALDRVRRALPDGVTVSGGLTEWVPDDSASMLLNRAESMLYQAKAQGRDRLLVHTDRSREAAELAHAIDDGQLRAFYQPIVDTVSGRLVGAEALVRWQHPERGLVPPAQFVPLAEEVGLIARLDRWILVQACHDAARWVHAGLMRKVSVNVCTQELQDPEFAQGVIDVLAATGLPPRCLTLEITEGSLEREQPGAGEALGRLRDLGVAVAVDDFGTGFSSISRLDQLPVDVLKIDRSFVSTIPPGEGGAPLVGVVVALGQALDLTVIAEGVETDHQRAALAALGCAESQGYLFGRPVPGAEFETLAAAWHGTPVVAGAPGAGRCSALTPRGRSEVS